MRDMDDPDRDENDYELIGRATVSWSDVELTWYLIYLTLNDLPRDQADAIYDIPNGFGSELKLISAIAEKVLADQPEVLKEFNILKSLTQERYGFRNAIAHGKYIFSRDDPADKALDLWAVGNNRLIGKALPGQFKLMDTEARALAEHCEIFLFKLCHVLGKEPPSIEK
jgi:hypothetical protein